jgi:hypothetical protein
MFPIHNIRDCQEQFLSEIFKNIFDKILDLFQSTKNTPNTCLFKEKAGGLHT